MKKTIMALIAGLMLAAPAALPSGLAQTLLPAAQAAEFKIGIVDVQKILSDSKLMAELNRIQKEVMDAEKKLADEYKKRAEELQSKRSTLSEEEFIKLQRKFEDEMLNLRKTAEQQLGLAAKREQMQQMKAKLEKDVEAAVKKVAADKGLNLVVTKQLVIYGGVDITQDVMNALPK